MRTSAGQVHFLRCVLLQGRPTYWCAYFCRTGPHTGARTSTGQVHILKCVYRAGPFRVLLQGVTVRLQSEYAHTAGNTPCGTEAKISFAMEQDFQHCGNEICEISPEPLIFTSKSLRETAGQNICDLESGRTECSTVLLLHRQFDTSLCSTHRSLRSGHNLPVSACISTQPHQGVRKALN